MNSDDPLERLLPPAKLSRLFSHERKRDHTLNVDQKTYEIVSAVAEQTGKSRPQVISAFIEMAYYTYAEQAKNQGIDPTKQAPAQSKSKIKRKKKK